MINLVLLEPSLYCMQVAMAVLRPFDRINIKGWFYELVHSLYIYHTLSCLNTIDILLSDVRLHEGPRSAIRGSLARGDMLVRVAN